MRKGNYTFTSESVSEGHPDKICDRISDAILDLHLRIDERARVAVETMVTTGRVILAGETKCTISFSKEEIEKRIRRVVRDIGYEQKSFHWNTLKVTNLIHGQSADISQGVDKGGAGDQGIMFGYACTETNPFAPDTFMPAPIFFAHKILRTIADARKSGKAEGLGPDAKSQITLIYENGKPVAVDRVLVSCQHDEGLENKVRGILLPLICRALPQEWQLKDENVYTNPTGKFDIGGPHGDAGLTGRKIIVDTYGGAAPHGGGAFSGKDPTKVDRSAAYMARHLAKNAVAAGLAERCTIQLSYAIGKRKPLSILVDFHGTGRIKETDLEEFLRDEMRLTPSAIRDRLRLRHQIYEPTSYYGHFGRKPDDGGSFSWERLNPKLIAELSALLP